MNSHRLNLRPVARQPSTKHEWRRRFIDAQMKELRGEPLSADETGLLARAELLMVAAPEMLEMLLADVDVDDVAAGEYRVAAAKTAVLYDQIVEAIRDGAERLYLDVNGSSVAVLRIDAGEGRVEPLHVEGYTYRVHRPNGEVQAVGRLGGIILGLEDLRDMTFTYDLGTKTIVLAPA